MRQIASVVTPAIAVLIASASLAIGQPDTAPQATAPAAGAGDTAPSEVKRVLTPEELAEKEARKACKQQICDIIATRDPTGEDISCDIVKTWREEDIVKILSGRISWPWGKAVCQSQLEIKRGPLTRAISDASYEMSMAPQKVRCTLSQKSDGEPYVVEITLAPRAKFENGKAVKAQINWGEASAPMFVYPLIYAGTALDNSANVLGGEVVRMINEFTTKKCTEVKAELGPR